MKASTCLAVLVLLACGSVASATQVLFNGTFAENFNEMGTGTAYPAGWSGYYVTGSHDTFTPADDPTNTGVLPTGAAIKSQGTTAVTTLTAATPTNQKGTAIYNWSAGGSDRALGTSPSGTAGDVLELDLTNNTGAPVTMLNVAYDVRVFSTTVMNNSYPSNNYVGIEELPGYELFYSLDNGTTWTNVSQLNGNGHTWANAIGTVHESLSNYALSSSWNAGTTMKLWWFDDNAQGPSPDQLLGLDNVNFTTTPEPATMGLLVIGGVLGLVRRNRK